MKPDWEVLVAKRDLLEAVGIARSRVTLRRKSTTDFERFIVISSCPGGISIRSSDASMDIAGEGVWNSPVMVPGAALRRLMPKIEGPDVRLTFFGGKLYLNGTSISAREA